MRWRMHCSQNKNIRKPMRACRFPFFTFFTYFSENSKCSDKMSDKYNERNHNCRMAGGHKEVDIAKTEYTYQNILPVGAVRQIRYLPRQGQQSRQEDRKGNAFRAYFELQLAREAPKEKDQRFQAYC